jgi:hypothetical protein
MRVIRLVAALAIVLACACGGDDDGGDAADDSGDDVGDDGGDDTGDDGGPDSTTALSELSTAEATELCESLNVTLDDALLSLQTVTCYLGGLAIGKDCEGYVDDCLAEEPVDEAPITCDLSSPAELPPCAADVTVGDLTDCFDGLFDVWGALADEITCDSVPEDFDDEIAVLPEACEVLLDLCPDL